MRPSRGMIPGELSWAVIAMIFAVAGAGIGPFDGGYLTKIVSQVAHPVIWALVLGAPAIALFTLGAVEWRAHCCQGQQAWTRAQLAKSVRWRGWMNLALIFSWGYLLKEIVLDAEKKAFTVTPAIAVAGIFFMFWFYKENRRVARDLRKHASLALAMG